MAKPPADYYPVPEPEADIRRIRIAVETVRRIALIRFFGACALWALIAIYVLKTY